MLGLLTVKAGALRLQRRGRLGGERQRLLASGVRTAAKEGAVAVVISAKIESEIATLSREERADFLETLGLEEPGLDRLIRAGYDLLRSHHLFHGRSEGSARLDHHQAAPRPAGGGRHSYRLRKRFHPRRNHRLRRLYGARWRSRRTRCRQATAGRKRIRRRRRRRHAFPVQYLESD